MIHPSLSTLFLTKVSEWCASIGRLYAVEMLFVWLFPLLAKGIWMGTGASWIDKEKNVITKYIFFTARLISIKISILRLKNKTAEEVLLLMVPPAPYDPDNSTSNYQPRCCLSARKPRVQAPGEMRFQWCYKLEHSMYSRLVTCISIKMSICFPDCSYEVTFKCVLICLYRHFQV